MNNHHFKTRQILLDISTWLFIFIDLFLFVVLGEYYFNHDIRLVLLEENPELEFYIHHLPKHPNQ